MVSLEVDQMICPHALLMSEYSIVFINKIGLSSQSKVVACLVKFRLHVCWQSFSTNRKILNYTVLTLVSGTSRMTLLKFFMFSGVTSQNGLRPTPNNLEIGSHVLSGSTCLSESQANLEPWWGEPTVIRFLTYLLRPSLAKANLASMPLSEKLTKSQVSQFKSLSILGTNLVNYWALY